MTVSQMWFDWVLGHRPQLAVEKQNLRDQIQACLVQIEALGLPTQLIEQRDVFIQLNQELSALCTSLEIEIQNLEKELNLQFLQVLATQEQNNQALADKLKYHDVQTHLQTALDVLASEFYFPSVETLTPAQLEKQFAESQQVFTRYRDQLKQRLKRSSQRWERIMAEQGQVNDQIKVLEEQIAQVKVEEKELSTELDKHQVEAQVLKNLEDMSKKDAQLFLQFLDKKIQNLHREAEWQISAKELEPEA